MTGVDHKGIVPLFNGHGSVGWQVSCGFDVVSNNLGNQRERFAVKGEGVQSSRFPSHQTKRVQVRRTGCFDKTKIVRDKMPKMTDVSSHLGWHRRQLPQPLGGLALIVNRGNQQLGLFGVCIDDHPRSSCNHESSWCAVFILTRVVEAQNERFIHVPKTLPSHGISNSIGLFVGYHRQMVTDPLSSSAGCGQPAT